MGDVFNVLANTKHQQKWDAYHVVFTSQVNAHPFLVSASFVFNIMWGKTVDYVNALRAETVKEAQQRPVGQPAKSIVPESLLFDDWRPAWAILGAPSWGNAQSECKVGSGLESLIEIEDVDVPALQGERQRRGAVAFMIVFSALIVFVVAAIACGLDSLRAKASQIVGARICSAEPSSGLESEPEEGLLVA